MRSLPDNRKSLKVHARLLSGAVAAVALTACAAQQTVQAGLLGPAPYYAVASNAGAPVQGTSGTGYFSQENGCIIFHPSSGDVAMIPVFPRGETALATDGNEWLGLFVKGSPVAMQKVYRLSGVDRTGQAVAITRPVPPGCPSTFFVVESVGKEIPAATLARYCTGVTLCRSFGMY